MPQIKERSNLPVLNLEQRYECALQGLEDGTFQSCKKQRKRTTSVNLVSVTERMDVAAVSLHIMASKYFHLRQSGQLFDGFLN